MCVPGTFLCDGYSTKSFKSFKLQIYYRLAGKDIHEAVIQLEEVQQRLLIE